LDFQNAHGTMYFASHDGPYKQTNVPMGYQYRDVAYIPIAVWRGVRQTNVQPQIDKEGSPVGAVQLIAPQMMAFGQFGVAQQLPITASPATKPLPCKLKRI
jgi:hypothetical protein